MIDNGKSRIIKFEKMHDNKGGQKLYANVATTTTKKGSVFLIFLPILVFTLFSFLFFIVDPFNIGKTFIAFYLTITSSISIMFFLGKVFNLKIKEREIEVVKIIAFDKSAILYDSFLKSLFPESYHYDRFRDDYCDADDILKKLNFMVSDKDYGREFSNILLQIINVKQKLPSKDREVLEKESSKRIREFYDLILENKKNYIMSGSNDIEKYILGYKELNKMEQE